MSSNSILGFVTLMVYYFKRRDENLELTAAVRIMIHISFYTYSLPCTCIRTLVYAYKYMHTFASFSIVPSWHRNLREELNAVFLETSLSFFLKMMPMLMMIIISISSMTLFETIFSLLFFFVIFCLTIFPLSFYRSICMCSIGVLVLCESKFQTKGQLNFSNLDLCGNIRCFPPHHCMASFCLLILRASVCVDVYSAMYFYCLSFAVIQVSQTSFFFQKKKPSPH